MKKFLKRFNVVVFLVFSMGNMLAQQIPYIPVDNFLFTGPGSATVTYPYGITAPTSPANADDLGGSAQVNFVAGQRVQLHDGFHAGGFTGNGYFRGQIGTAADFDVAFIQPNQNTPSVGQFEKLEIGVQLPANLEQQVNAFLANGAGGINPFDPDEISLEATFNRGQLSYKVYGFYYEDFARDPAAMTPFAPAIWIPQPTNYNWRIRFSPPYLGNWTCTISIHINRALTASYQVSNLVFNCVNSSNQGYLKKGNDDWHLAYSGSNRSFFALGQNIGWNDGNQFYGGQDPNNSYPRFFSGYLDVQDWVSDLSAQGGNMVRICVVPWSFELESNRLNNYSDRLDHAWELDKLVELCEQKDLKIAFSFYDKRWKPDDNGDQGWNNNPYHLNIPGVSFPEDFLTNPTAIRIFKNKIRYFLSRWGYSSSVGIFELISEINAPNTFHDIDLVIQADLLLWESDMLLYSKQLVNYRPLLTTTSYVTNQGPIFDLPQCDITAIHSYHNERSVNIQRFLEFNGILSGLGTHYSGSVIWKFKPTYFEEMGLHENDQPLTQGDVGDKEGCSDINYHNALWATAFMGGIGSGLVWWGWNSNDYRHNNFPALSTFFNGMDFQNVFFTSPDFWDDDPIGHRQSKIETFNIVGDGGRRAMGWMHNATYWWGNTDQSCPDRNNIIMTLPNDDDTPTSPINVPIGSKIEVHGLNNLKNYTVDYYGTRGNGGQFHSLAKQSNIFGTLKPDWIGNDPDMAFKAYRSGENFRENPTIETDTLFCWQDTIYAYGNHELDTLRSFGYYWNFGNGQVSSERNPIVIYDQPGRFLVTLVVFDSLGWSDTLRQYIVKPQSCSSSRLSVRHEIEYVSSWNVFPNPTSKGITLTFDSTWSRTISMKMFSLDGKCVLSQMQSPTSNEEIPLEHLPSGVYLLRVEDNRHVEVKRIIIEH